MESLYTRVDYLPVCQHWSTASWAYKTYRCSLTLSWTT